MKTIKLLTSLSFITACLLWSAFAPMNEEQLSLCVNNEAGEPLIYVDVKDTNGTLLARTDLNGCLSVQTSKEQLEVILEYPGYNSQQIDLVAGKTQAITLDEIKYLPPVRMPSGELVTLKEAIGDFLIQGIVQDEGKEPLIGASILIEGTTMGTVTDIDGTFSLNAPTECVNLTVSYTGFEMRSGVEACSGKSQKIVLSEGVALDEVVFTGLGSRRKKRSASVVPLSYDATSAPATMSAPPPPPPPPAAIAEPVFATEVSEESYAVFDDDVAYKSVEGELGAKDGGPLPGAGQLTAGEINDFSKWNMWTDINQEDLGMYRTTWQQYADHRYTLQLTNKEGAAINNAAVELVDGQGNVRWKSRTDAQGRAELWAHYFEDVRVAANGLMIRGEAAGKRFELPNVKPFREGINFHSLRTDCREDAMIDIAFVVDATGSMGDEISYLQAELLDVINRVQSALPAADLQMGSVFYRDKGEQYLTKTQVLTKDPVEALAFLQQQGAQGGGDYPEAVETALEAALDSLQWRDAASTRLLFLVLDAPPHAGSENLKRLQVAVTKAAARGIQIVPVSCSGVDKSTEYLLRSMALATNGTYTFVTDHSGIGNAHIEPSTDAYEVEFLNDVLVRLTVSMSELADCEAPIAISDPIAIPDTPERAWDYYPNPSSGPLTIRFAEANGTFYLADTQGKLLQRFAAADGMALDLSPYPAGTYWLRHEDKEGVLSQGQVLLLRR